MRRPRCSRGCRSDPTQRRRCLDTLARAHAAILTNRFSFLPVQDEAGAFAGLITALRLAALVEDLMRLGDGRTVTVRLDELAARGRAGAVCVVPDDPGLIGRTLEKGPRLLVSCGPVRPEAGSSRSRRPSPTPRSVITSTR